MRRPEFVIGDAVITDQMRRHGIDDAYQGIDRATLRAIRREVGFEVWHALLRAGYTLVRKKDGKEVL